MRVAKRVWFLKVYGPVPQSVVTGTALGLKKLYFVNSIVPTVTISTSGLSLLHLATLPRGTATTLGMYPSILDLGHEI